MAAMDDYCQGVKGSFPRTPPRLKPLYISEPVYFITVCTQNRQAVLAHPDVDGAFLAFAARAEVQHHIAVGRYVMMPDHLHLFVRGPTDFRLSSWIGLLKQHLTRAIRRTRKGREPYWQRGFFDHVLRSSESYGQKWNYVMLNPVRRGLVTKAEAWPYAGEIARIDRI